MCVYVSPRRVVVVGRSTPSPSLPADCVLKPIHLSLLARGGCWEGSTSPSLSPELYSQSKSYASSLGIGGVGDSHFCIVLILYIEYMMLGLWPLRG